MIPIYNAVSPSPNLLLGGQPTESHLLAACDAGYKTVINLRGVGEEGTDWEPQAVAALGMTYVHIPIAGAAGVNRANADRLRAAIDAAGDDPVVVHCASGNRVGALFALLAYEGDAATVETAIEVGRAHGLTGLESWVRQLLSSLG